MSNQNLSDMAETPKHDTASELLHNVQNRRRPEPVENRHTDNTETVSLN